MMDYTVSDIYRNFRENNSQNNAFFKTIKNSLGEDYNFEKSYISKPSRIDNHIIQLYGSRVFPCPSYFSESEKEEFYTNKSKALETFQDMTSAILEENADMYERAFEVLNADYEPLYNTDKHSVIEETHRGDLLIKSGIESDSLSKTGIETDTLNISGSETDTLSKFGTETNTNTKNGTETDTLTKNGTETDTLTKNGTEKETISKDAYADTFKKLVSPDNSETFYNSEKSDNSYGSQKEENTTSFTNRTDTNTKAFNNRTDTNTKQIVNIVDENISSFSADRKDENIKTFSDRKDENVKSFTDRKDENVKSFTDRKDSTDYTITTKEDSKGNIGVKSSTELMLEEYKVRMLLNFYLQIFKEILFEITY